MDNRKRILHFRNTLGWDGMTIVEYRIALQLKDEFVFDWFIFGNKIGPYEEKFRELGSQIVHLEDIKLQFRARTLESALYKFLKNSSYDTVYFDTEFAGRSWLMFISGLAGVKYRVIHSHNTGETRHTPKLVNGFFKLLMKFVTTDYLACSREAAEWLFPHSCLNKVKYVKNGIDTESFRFTSTKRDRIRKQFGISDATLVIGNVGRLSKQKNQIKAIDILSAVKKKTNDVILLIVGSGELETEMKEYVRQKNLTDCVIFAGGTNDVASFYCAMDVFLLPSLYEGFGIVSIEASAAGLPVLMSDKTPNEVLLNENMRQLSLEASDEAWANCILKMADLKINRDEAWRNVKDSGYDIHDCVDVVRTVLQHRKKT